MGELFLNGLQYSEILKLKATYSVGSTTYRNLIYAEIPHAAVKKKKAIESLSFGKRDVNKEAKGDQLIIIIQRRAESGFAAAIGGAVNPTEIQY